MRSQPVLDGEQARRHNTVWYDQTVYNQRDPSGFQQVKLNTSAPRRCSTWLRVEQLRGLVTCKTTWVKEKKEKDCGACRTEQLTKRRNQPYVSDIIPSAGNVEWPSRTEDSYRMNDGSARKKTRVLHVTLTSTTRREKREPSAVQHVSTSMRSVFEAHARQRRAGTRRRRGRTREHDATGCHRKPRRSWARVSLSVPRTCCSALYPHRRRRKRREQRQHDRVLKDDTTIWLKA